MSTETFVCQRCNSKLNLDESLLNLNETQLNLLLKKAKGAEESEDVDELDSGAFLPADRRQLLKDVIGKLEEHSEKDHTIRSKDEDIDIKNSSSYVYLAEMENDTTDRDAKEDEGADIKASTDHSLNTISHRLKRVTRMFEILSTHSDIEHPLCVECCDLLTQSYETKYDEIQKDKESYLSFLRKLKEKNFDNVAPGELDTRLSSTINEYHDLSKQNKEQLAELKALEQKKVELTEELGVLEKGLSDFDRNEVSELMKQRNNLQLKLRFKFDKLEQCKTTYQTSLDHLDSLRNTNIYTSFYSIKFDADDQYGSINGYRLGYKIPWPEVNAALGQIVLLLTFLVRRLKIQLKDYKLVAMGSHSSIVKYSNQNSDSSTTEANKGKSKTILHLCTSNDFSLGKLFNFNKLDISLIALLDVVSHIQNRLREIDPEIELPYQISRKRDRIGGKSIRVTAHTEWTQSCKNLLTNLNWFLAYTSAHTSPEP